MIGIKGMSGLDALVKMTVAGIHRHRDTERKGNDHTLGARQDTIKLIGIVIGRTEMGIEIASATVIVTVIATADCPLLHARRRRHRRPCLLIALVNPRRRLQHPLVLLRP